MQNRKGKTYISRHHTKRILLNKNNQKEFGHSSILQDNSYLSVLLKKISTSPNSLYSMGYPYL